MCRDPKTKKRICTSCYTKLPEKMDICPECGKGPRPLMYRDPKTKKRICQNCYKSLFKELRETDLNNEFLGNIILGKIIIECEANYRLMLDSLLKNYGIKMGSYKFSKLIASDKELEKLDRETRKARRKKKEEIQALSKTTNENKVRLTLDKLEKEMLRSRKKTISEILVEIVQSQSKVTQTQVEARFYRSIPAKYGLEEGQFEEAQAIFEIEEGLVLT